MGATVRYAAKVKGNGRHILIQSKTPIDSSLNLEERTLTESLGLGVVVAGKWLPIPTEGNLTQMIYDDKRAVQAVVAALGLDPKKMGTGIQACEMMRTAALAALAAEGA